MRYWVLYRARHNIAAMWHKHYDLPMEINDAHRICNQDFVRYPTYHFMVVEQGTDLTTIPAPIEKVS